MIVLGIIGALIVIILIIFLFDSWIGAPKEHRDTEAGYLEYLEKKAKDPNPKKVPETTNQENTNSKSKAVSIIPDMEYLEEKEKVIPDCPDGQHDWVIWSKRRRCRKCGKIES